jgi:hypothetical protein
MADSVLRVGTGIPKILLCPAVAMRREESVEWAISRFRSLASGLWLLASGCWLL